MILTPKITMDADIVTAFATSTEEQGQIILHCRNLPTSQARKFISRRISKNTNLADCTSNHKSQLVYAEGISIAPQCKLVKVGIYYHFTLVFEGLPNLVENLIFSK